MHSTVQQPVERRNICSNPCQYEFDGRVAISGNPMCGRYVVGKGHSHEAVYDFVGETETGHRSSPFKGLSAQLRPLYKF